MIHSPAPTLVQHVLERLQDNLPQGLAYHNAAHTAYVMGSAYFLAENENLPEASQSLLEAAALYHDTGFLLGLENHELTGCQLARAELPAFGFDAQQIEEICGMIMATRIPQQPTTLAERILADADLYYLGTDNYIKYSSLLYQELKHFNPALSLEEWYHIQVNFLRAHRYHTAYAIEVLEPIKQANLYLLIEGVEGRQ